MEKGDTFTKLLFGAQKPKYLSKKPSKRQFGGGGRGWIILEFLANKYIVTPKAYRYTGYRQNLGIILS